MESKQLLKRLQAEASPQSQMILITHLPAVMFSALGALPNLLPG